MLKPQNNYDFKKELLEIHKKDVFDPNILPSKSEFVFDNDCKIVLLDQSQVILTAVRDFEDYLFTSQNVSVSVVNGGNIKDSQKAVIISINKNLEKANGYMGYKISVTRRRVKIEGFDERGIAQALYYLEDRMNVKKAPYLSRGVTERKALFSPRIVQSPFGMFSYPDEAFSIMAHKGFDAIDVWIKDAYTDKRGYYIDLNLLAERAKKYGIDVYIELFAPHSAHPDDEGAQEFYDKLYGEIFRVCPIIKGITLVGEATNFCSKDPAVGLSPFSKNFIDNIPTGRTSPGWWPCNDYPAWVTMIKNAVRKYSDSAEIVFCTYNWGFTPEEERIKLINALPTDITLLATFDMFHKYKVGSSVEDICDYSLSFIGPGEYFKSEALAAKKRNIKLSSISNTGGRTWDFGVIPYEPMPEQWIKRFKAIVKANKDYNLSGLVETIHYGFHPSFINDLAKYAFFTNGKPLEKILLELLERDFGKENARTVKRATELLSKAIQNYVPTNEDQYGAFRVGPSYPLWSGALIGLPSSIPDQGRQPSRPHAMFGNGVYFGVYTPDEEGKNSLPGTRIFDELKALDKMHRLICESVELLESIENPNDNLLRFILLVKFIRNTTRTGINVKRHYLIKQELSVAKTKSNAKKIIDKLEKLILEERENVLDTIPLVQLDSRLGWEPSMEYTTDEKGLRWKLRQLDYELNVKIENYKRANNLKV